MSSLQKMSNTFFYKGQYRLINPYCEPLSFSKHSRWLRLISPESSPNHVRHDESAQIRICVTNEWCGTSLAIRRHLTDKITSLNVAIAFPFLTVPTIHLLDPLGRSQTPSQRPMVQVMWVCPWYYRKIHVQYLCKSVMFMLRSKCSELAHF